MLDFGHEEFTDSEETLARRDFVAKGFSDRGGGEGHTEVVVFVEFGEVEELALGSFGAKVSGEGSC